MIEDKLNCVGINILGSVEGQSFKNLEAGLESLVAQVVCRET
jgi:hypothetical protein